MALAARKKVLAPQLAGMTPQRTRVKLPSFTPYVAPPLPTGTYDPALDAQKLAADRGLQDTTQDFETANTRGAVDYGLKREDIQRQAGYATDDFQTQRDTLNRSFAQLANRERQSINAAGLGSGGAALQAAAKRAQAQSLSAAQISTAQGRQQTATDLSLGQLALQYAPANADGTGGGRDFQDRQTQLQRAQREGLQFGVDTEAEKQYQAAGAGYVSPTSMPKNESVDAYGQHTQTRVVGNVKYTVDSTGKILSKEPLPAAQIQGGAVGNDLYERMRRKQAASSLGAAAGRRTG